MHEHTRDCEKRNEVMEMACHSVFHDDRIGLFGELGSISTVEIKKKRSTGERWKYLALASAFSFFLPSPVVNTSREMILVTGANGQIGTVLTEALRNKY